MENKREVERSPFNEEYIDGPILFIGAHPDDIMITSAALISRNLQKSFIIDITDGAIHRPDYYPNRAGFRTWKEYSKVRRLAKVKAIEQLGLDRDHLFFLNFPDSELYRNIADAIIEVSRAVSDIKPKVIFSHSFEGGHPDHDVAHFITEKVFEGSNILEFPIYHVRNGVRMYGKFKNGDAEYVLKLYETEKQLKRKVLSEFYFTDLLGRYSLEEEIFRPFVPTQLSLSDDITYDHIPVVNTGYDEVREVLEGFKVKEVAYER